MGRIKSAMIKRTARNLINLEPELSTDFEKNKRILSQYDFPDKGTRNRIAGYIVRLKKAGSIPKPRSHSPLTKNLKETANKEVKNERGQ
ncbi:MAG: 30S ribosomal protein S17e [Candidatus Pacearchaeota archaeon]